MSRDPRETVFHAIHDLLRRKDSDGEIDGGTVIQELLDSLDVAELSAMLEDELGRDPYSDGVVPRTVGELASWYER